MVLSTRPMPPLVLPLPSGERGEVVMPRRVRHIVRLHWRYHVEQLQYAPGEWGGVAITDQHYFQPKHRRARRAWRDTRPSRRSRILPRCLTRTPIN